MTRLRLQDLQGAADVEETVQLPAILGCQRAVARLGGQLIDSLHIVWPEFQLQQGPRGIRGECPALRSDGPAPDLRFVRVVKIGEVKKGQCLRAWNSLVAIGRETPEPDSSPATPAIFLPRIPTALNVPDDFLLRSQNRDVLTTAFTEHAGSRVFCSVRGIGASGGGVTKLWTHVGNLTRPYSPEEPPARVSQGRWEVCLRSRSHSQRNHCFQMDPSPRRFPIVSVPTVVDIRNSLRFANFLSRFFQLLVLAAMGCSSSAASRPPVPQRDELLRT